MQITLEDVVNRKTPKNSMMSIPSSFNAGKILGESISINSQYEEISANPLKGLWDKQHPIIHTWLLLSSISIFFLSAIFFISP